jgi:hypothetical protein
MERTMQSFVPDIDQAIAEFKAAVGDLFSTPERREIELLKSRIEARKRARKGTAILQHELVELMAAQIQRELAA